MQTLFFIPFINYVSNHLNIWRGLSWCIAVAALWWCGRAQSSWRWHVASRKGKANEKKKKKKSSNHQEPLSLETGLKLADSRWPKSWPDTESKRELLMTKQKLYSKLFHCSWFRLNWIMVYNLFIQQMFADDTNSLADTQFLMLQIIAGSTQFLQSEINP